MKHLLAPVPAPNFKDPRVQKRMRKVLAWCETNLSEKYASPVPKQNLIKVFGNIDNITGVWLRAQLLHSDDFYKKGWRCKTYALKYGSVDKLKNILSKYEIEVEPTNDSPICDVEELYLRYTTDKVIGLQIQKLQFQYTRGKSGNRYCHPLQLIKKKFKDELWARWGLPYDYDIMACAANVLCQEAQLKQPSSALQPLINYVNNSRDFRQQLSNLTGLETSIIKDIIAALINGARLIRGKAIWDMILKADLEPFIIMPKLKNDPELVKLLGAVRYAWKIIDPQIKTASQKAQHYQKQESVIIKIISDYLTEHNIKHFLEHDGWRCDQQINIPELEQHLLARTGLQLRIAI